MITVGDIRKAIDGLSDAARVRLAIVNDPPQMVDVEFYRVESTRFWMCQSESEKDDEDGSPLYWSNKDGWVSKDSADIFNQREMQLFNPPIGGKWVSDGESITIIAEAIVGEEKEEEDE